MSHSTEGDKESKGTSPMTLGGANEEHGAVEEVSPALSIDAIHFGHPDSPDNILYTDDKQIKGATLPKLIEKLSESKTEVKMIFDFLLTYRTYADPEFLLALLRKRFECPAPPSLSGADLDKFLASEQTIVRLKYAKLKLKPKTNSTSNITDPPN